MKVCGVRAKLKKFSDPTFEGYRTQAGDSDTGNTSFKFGHNSSESMKLHRPISSSLYHGVDSQVKHLHEINFQSQNLVS